MSVDFKRDTPSALRAYLTRFDPEFVGVTAPDATLEPLLDSLGIAVEKGTDKGSEYTVVPSTRIFFVGPKTELLARSIGPQEPRTLASDYLRIRGRYLATHRATAP